mgnify:FL=1
MAVTREVLQSSEQFVGWKTYLKNHRSAGGEVFKTRDSLEWFCRRNTEALIASGQLIPRRGPAGTLYGPHFTQVALNILREIQLNARLKMTVTESQDSPR